MSNESHAAMRERILAAARTELASVGPVMLSMRAIAREVGVTVGALYRYFADRDAVLTELIVEAYESIGAAARQGVEQGGTPGEQWMRGWSEVRAWAIAHPQEFVLVYGTPVIGYAAPERTIAAANQLFIALLSIFARADAVPAAEHPAPPLTPGLATDIAQARSWASAVIGDSLDARFSDARILGFMRAWTELIGAIGFEMHGHYVGSLDHGDEFFAHIAATHAEVLGLEN